MRRYFEEAARGCRVVIVTDFLGDSDALIKAARTFVASGGELHAIHVVDQGELDPDPKKLLLADPERAVFNIHVPPHETNLDQCAELRALLVRRGHNPADTR